MDVVEQPNRRPAAAQDQAGLDVRDRPTITAEVERLLTFRTRDIRLKGEIKELFRTRTWSQTAKIIRAWMMWVAVLHVMTMATCILLLPAEVATSMLLPGALIVPAVFGVVVAWREPYSQWLQGFALIAGISLVLVSVALIGVNAGGEFYERNLHIMLFIAISAIIIFGIPLAWTVTIAVIALSLYLFFQLANPALALGSVVSSTLFFTAGIFATVAARRNMTLLAVKTFLFELRDRRRVVDLAEVNDRLNLLARTDPLTGLANRRWMTETLDHIWGDGPDGRESVVMLMCDIDDFKKLNDHLGHAEGDRCLIDVAAIIRKSVRQDVDHVARYGGEEFIVLLPGVGMEEAAFVAERIREAVESAAIPNPESRVARHVTLSIGLAARGANDEALSSEQLQSNADAALYVAKQSGRNRVEIHRPQPLAAGNKLAFG
jgi:diguanylate cyclase (GGDEF)-like protein